MVREKERGGERRSVWGGRRRRRRKDQSAVLGFREKAEQFLEREKIFQVIHVLAGVSQLLIYYPVSPLSRASVLFRLKCSNPSDMLFS